MEIISKNERNSNERIVCSLKEIEKRKIVEHNDLITSVAKMDKTPLKIFELAVSCIDTENLPKDNTIYLSKEELFTFFDVSDNGKHSRFKEAISKMQEQAFFEVREAKNKGFKFRRAFAGHELASAPCHDSNFNHQSHFGNSCSKFLKLNSRSHHTRSSNWWWDHRCRWLCHGH